MRRLRGTLKSEATAPSKGPQQHESAGQLQELYNSFANATNVQQYKRKQKLRLCILARHAGS